MTVRVAFNATPLLAPLTGIGNYIVELGAALAVDGDLDLYAYYGLGWRHEAPAPPAQTGATAATRAILRQVRARLPLRRVLRSLWPHTAFRRGLRHLRIDVYHEPNYAPLAYDVPVAVTIHDLSWMHDPEAHPDDRVRWLDRAVPRALQRAAVILVDSAFVRDEIVKTFGVDTRRLLVAPLGVAQDFRPRAAEETAVTLDPLGLSHGHYVLTVGTLEPRKNMAHIVAAHRLLPHAVRERFPLVIAGARGWQATAREVRAEADADEHVRLLGSVPRSELLNLYAGAAVFAFPSRYEGFGLPPLEAMASGVPVLVSHRAAMPEVVGDAGLYLEPDDPESTARQLRALLEDRARRGVFGARGRDRARAFTWARCAVATRRAYSVALGAPPADR